MKRLPTVWEKIFASYLNNEGLEARIYKELKKLVKEQTIQLINGQMNCTDSSQKKYKWLINT
jgi:hypothetical protein